MKLSTQKGLSLLAVAVLSMLVASAAMLALYTMRHGHLPMPEVWDRWGKSAKVISGELKKASGLTTQTQESGQANSDQGGNGMPAPVTIGTGARRCTINGKVTYSDTECLDSNPTTKQIKLHETQGFTHPKPPASDTETGNDGEQDLRMKALEKALDKATK